MDHVQEIAQAKNIVNLEFEGHSLQVRVVPATEKRPAVAYLSGPGADNYLGALVGQATGTASEMTPSGGYAASFVPNEILAKAGLTAPCIFLKEPPLGASKNERLFWGMVTAHEFTHANGGAEYSAHFVGDDYLARNSLPRLFRDSEALFNFLGSVPLYGERAEKVARLERDLELLLLNQDREKGPAKGILPMTELALKKL